MVDILRNQNSCKHCWRPSLNTDGERFVCPTCGAKYTKEFKPIAFPSVEVYKQNVLSLISSILGNSITGLSFQQLSDHLGLDKESNAEQWILSVHHLNCQYRYYRKITNKPKNNYILEYFPITPAPPSKRSYPGEFNDYKFSYWRIDYSPLANLSDNAFDVVNSADIRRSLPYPINHIGGKVQRRCFSKPNNYRNFTVEYWQNGIDELMKSNLVEKASTSDILELVSIKELREKLKEQRIKIPKDRKSIVELALENLPVNVLDEITNSIQGHFPLQSLIDEFALRLYGLQNLHDSVRYYNVSEKEQFTPEQFTKTIRESDGTPAFYEIVIALLENARNSPNYETSLSNGVIPAEAFLAETYAKLEKYDLALDMANRAYKLDIANNSVSQVANINHFGSLAKLKLSLELIVSNYEKYQGIECFPKDTENAFKMWVTLYDRGSDDGFTPFLLANYDDIFENFGDCSRDSENKYRDLLGIPRIGEGWVSEVELLNLVRNIFPNENVIHQGSPDWIGLQRLDIYIPRMKLAIEYQGKQHYEPVKLFGGDEGFRRTQERDKRKADLCANNGVSLIYFRYDEPITQEAVEQRIKSVIKNRKVGSQNAAG